MSTKSNRMSLHVPKTEPVDVLVYNSDIQRSGYVFMGLCKEIE